MPTSMAKTQGAPLCERTSVKPPVDRDVEADLCLDFDRILRQPRGRLTPRATRRDVPVRPAARASTE